MAGSSNDSLLVSVCGAEFIVSPGMDAQAFVSVVSVFTPTNNVIGTKGGTIVMY